MMYRFQLDGIVVPDAINWRNFDETIYFDSDLRCQLKKVNVSLEFRGRAFEMLWRKAQTNWDSETEIKIYESPNSNGSFVLIYTGIILTSQIEFNHTDYIAAAKIKDASFDAMLNGGKSVKVNIEAELSKNGTAITPAQRSILTVVNPCTGITPGLTEPVVWRLEDALRHIISFISDGRIDFACDFLEQDGDFSGLCITTGQFLHSVVPGSEARAPSVSLLECLNEIARKVNSAFYIDETGTRPVFTLGYVDDIRTELQSVHLQHVRPIKTGFDTNRIYSSIKFGTDDYVEKLAQVCSDAAYFEELDFYTVKEEEYTVIGTNNIDNQLDLSTDWIISSNLIQASYFNINTDNDDRIFLIDALNDITYASSFTVDAVQEDILGNGGAIFNTRLFNSAVAARYLGGVPQDIVLRLSPISDFFKAVVVNDTGIHYYNTGSSAGVVEPMRFNDDFLNGFDPANAYGNGTAQGNNVSQANSRWTATDTGIVGVDVYIWVRSLNDISLIHPAGYEVSLQVRRYDSGNNLLTTFSENYIQGTNIDFQVDNFEPMRLQRQLYVDAGDYLQVAFEIITTGQGNSQMSIKELISYFEIISDGFSGGTMNTYDPNEFAVYTIEGSALLDLEKWNVINRNRFDMIRVSDDFDNSFSGWISEITYKRVTREFEYKLTSTNSSLL